MNTSRAPFVDVFHGVIDSYQCQKTFSLGKFLSGYNNICQREQQGVHSWWQHLFFSFFHYEIRPENLVLLKSMKWEILLFLMTNFLFLSCLLLLDLHQQQQLPVEEKIQLPPGDQVPLRHSWRWKSQSWSLSCSLHLDRIFGHASFHREVRRTRISRTPNPSTWTSSSLSVDSQEIAFCHFCTQGTWVHNKLFSTQMYRQLTRHWHTRP